MTANVIAFAGRTANRNTAPLSAAPFKRAMATAAADVAAEVHDNIVPIAAWFDRARPRRTPNGVFFTSRVLATTGFNA